MDKRLKDDIQISLGGAALFGFAVYLIMLRINKNLWYLSIVAAVAMAAIIIGFLLGYNRFVTKRYARAIEAVGLPVQFQTMGNFSTELGKRTGNIYFCGDRIVLISLDKKPHMTIEVLLSDVESIEIPRTVQMDIQLKDGNYQTIHSVDVGALNSVMKKKNRTKKK